MQPSSNIPPVAKLPDDPGSSSATGVNIAPAVDAPPGCAQLPEVRFFHWAWNAQMGLMLATGGKQATQDSLMCKAGVNLRLLRVNDDIDWNMPGCRNLAATLCETPWMLFFDVDNVCSEASLQKIVNNLPRLDASRLHVFRRTENGVDVEPHINSFLITRQGFFKAGGYDEDFSGHYGFEDVAFRMMWRKHVGGEVLLTDIAFEQDVTACEQRHIDQPQRVVLADHRATHFLFDAQRQSAPVLQGFGREHWTVFRLD